MLGLALLAPFAASASAQAPAPLDEAEQRAVLERAAELIDTRFFDAERGRRCATDLRARLARGEYRATTEPAAFAARVTADLRAALDDQHALLAFDPEPPPSDAAPDPATTPATITAPPRSREERDAELREAYRPRNFDFREVRVLEGNVGYLRLFTFAPARLGRETATAALHFLANSDAILLDLRGNQGGYPDMGLFLASFFFERATHYADVYRREGDRVEQQWTTPFVEAPSLARQELFVLLGRDSFSGAESLAYNLQALGRATVVGEKTRGGATGVNTLRVSPRFQLNVADVNFTNPVSGSNWERTGVVPDIACGREEALVVAHRAALERLAAKSDDAARRTELAWARELVDARAHPPELAPSALATLCGQYGPRRVWLEGGALWYRRDEDAIQPLRPVAAERFMIDGVAGFQLRFERDERGIVARAVACYPDGSSDTSERVP